MHKFNDLDTFYDQQAIGNVRRLVQQLREAALSPIPDLDAVSPPEGWKVGDKKLDAWAKKAEARALEVVQWRRRVEALIGDIDEGHRGEEEPGIGQVLVPNDQTLLGLFHAAVPDGVIRRADGSVKELAYVPGSHPILYLGNARLYLGVPPAHLVWPAHYNRLNGAAPLGRNNWPEYGEILLSQALIVRTRALELCAWCEQRIEAWESAFYPTIFIGPERSRGRSRTLKVFVASQRIPLPKDTISDEQAKRLLSLRGGKAVYFKHRKYMNDLVQTIPQLSGLWRNTHKGTGETTQGGHYCLPPQVRILELEPDENLQE